MNISTRLKLIAKKIEFEKKIADIGTDHAYIPIFLCSESNVNIDKIYACDVSRECFEKAKSNIIKNSLEHKIIPKLGSGLSALYDEDVEIDAIIISGMGGILIKDILSFDINKMGGKILKNVKKLILQPQRDIEVVRKFLHFINFKIVEEEILKEDNKFYNIIVSKNCKEKEKYSEEDYIFGKILIQKNPVILKEFVLLELKKIEEIISFKDINYERRKELTKKYNLCKEVFNCLQNVEM